MLETENGKDTWKASIEIARGHFDEGFRDLAKAAQQARSQGQEAWETAQVRMRQTWEDAQSKGVEAWEQTRERGIELLAESRHYVRRNPSQAIALSALTGFMVGLFLAAGRRE